VENTSQLPPFLGLSRASDYEPRSTTMPGVLSAAGAIPQSRLDKIKLREFVDAAERYRPQLIWLAMRIVNRSEEAEDIVQQALLKAFRKLSGFRGDSQMRTWLNAIVRNTAREYLRSQRGRTFVPLETSVFCDEGSEEIEIADPGMNPEECCEQREREDMVTAAIGRMGPPNREVVEMCVFEELPYMQVAMALNLSLTTIKSRMFRSRRDLRMALSSCAGAFK
jgi:RNA polymerase sigma-70 factor, ECF subfamily